MGIIERVVRRHVAQSGDSAKLRRERGASNKILVAARAVDSALERSEVARIAAEVERDKAIYELERLFHFIPALLIFKDLDGTMLRVNENAARGFGLRPSDMVGHMPEEFYPPEQCARFRLDDEEVLKTGRGKYGYLESVEWGGESHIFRAWKIPIYNGCPRPIGIMLFAVNVTQIGDLSVEELGEKL